MTASPRHPAVSSCYHTEATCIRGNNTKAEHRRQGTGEGKFYYPWCNTLAPRRVVAGVAQQVKEDRGMGRLRTVGIALAALLIAGGWSRTRLHWRDQPRCRR